MERTESVKRFVHQKVLKALANSRLPYDHAIGELLEREAEIVGEKACVRIVDHEGLEKRIEQLKADERFRDSLPNPNRIAGDESSVRDNFDEIAKARLFWDSCVGGTPIFAKPKHEHAATR